MDLLVIYFTVLLLATGIHRFCRNRKRITIHRPAVWFFYGSILSITVFVIYAAITPQAMNMEYGGGHGLFTLLVELTLVFGAPVAFYLTGKATSIWYVQNISRNDLFDSVIEVLTRNGVTFREEEITNPVDKEMMTRIALVDHDAYLDVIGEQATCKPSFHIKNGENIPGFRKVLDDLQRTVRSREFQVNANPKSGLLVMMFLAAIFFLLLQLI